MDPWRVQEGPCSRTLCIDFIIEPAYDAKLIQQVRNRFGELDSLQAHQIADAVRTAYCNT